MIQFFLLTLISTAMMGCSHNNNDMLIGNQSNSVMAEVEANNLAGVIVLINKGVDIDSPNKAGETPLLKATQRNYVDIAKVLLEAGADVNKQDKIQDSPFLYACAEGRTDILRVMLDYNPDVKIVNRYGGNGLIPAAEKGHLENVRILLEKTDMDVNHVNRLGWTALLEAVILTSGGEVHQNIIRTLIEHGADVNLPDKQGITPLAHARIKGYKAIEQILLNAGAHE